MARMSRYLGMSCMSCLSSFLYPSPIILIRHSLSRLFPSNFRHQRGSIKLVPVFLSACMVMITCLCYARTSKTVPFRSAIYCKCKTPGNPKLEVEPHRLAYIRMATIEMSLRRKARGQYTVADGSARRAALMSVLYIACTNLTELNWTRQSKPEFDMGPFCWIQSNPIL